MRWQGCEFLPRMNRTDKRVNLVTRELFQLYRTALDYAAISQEVLEGLVRSTGFYRNKAKNIRAMGQVLVERHSGEVPDSLAELAASPNGSASPNSATQFASSRT